MAGTGKMQKPKEFTETRSIMLCYFLMLVVISIASVYTYGFRALNVIIISVATTMACKKICEEMTKTEYPQGDFSGVVTGLMIALLLPATVPYYVPFFAGIFAVIVCMLPFGTAKNSPFVPSVAAMCFSVICFGEKVFSYPEISNGIFNAERVGTSLTALLSSGTTVRLNLATATEILTGQIPSAMGTGFVIVLIGALLFLVIRYPKNTIPALAFLVSSSIFAIIVRRVSTGALTSFVMEMCGGVILFSAVFFMTYPSVLPTRTYSRILWGIATGIVCMAFRYFGKFEDSAIFGVLIMNATASLFDELPLTKFEKKKLDDATSFTEINEEQPTAIVPEEILNEIPDISEEEILAQEEETQEEYKTDDISTVVNAENNIDETAPFKLGGDSNE